LGILSKYGAIIISLIVIGEFASAQTFDSQNWHDTIAPYGRNLRDIQILDNNTLIAVGGNETNDSIASLFRSEDRGASWSIILDVFNGPWLQAVDFPTAQVGYAVGFDGFVLKTTDEGVDWDTLVLSGNIAGRHYNDVAFISETIGFAVGGNKTNDSIQTIISTTNGGDDWTPLVDNLGGWLKAVTFVSSSVGYACGDDGVVLKTVNGGSNWNALSLPLAVETRTFNDIHFLDESIGFALGGKQVGDSIQTLIRTENGGDSWTVLFDDIGGAFNDVEFSTDLKGILVGDDEVAFTTEDGGLNWTPYTIPTLYGDEFHFNTVHFISTYLGMAVTSNGLVQVWPIIQVVC